MNTVDLDALVPDRVLVKIGGEEYPVETKNGMPLKAVFKGMKFSDPNKRPSAEELVEFIADVTPIPRDKLAKLTLPQFNALMGVLFPKDENEEGKPTKDDPADPTKQGTARMLSSGGSSAMSLGGTGSEGII